MNLKGAFLAAKAVIPLTRQRGGGRIIMISTIGGAHPVLHGNSAYSASRAGLNQFTREAKVRCWITGCGVRSIDGLRAANASVMRVLISGNTNSNDRCGGTRGGTHQLESRVK